MNKNLCKHIGAENEKLVSFFFAKRIDHQALPQNIDLMLFQSFAV